MLYALIALFVIILVLAGLYARACYWNVQHYNGMQKALEDLNKVTLDYQALDQGMNELSDAYETDSLQYEDTIENLNIEKTRLAENNSTLLHNSRVDMTARHELQRRNTQQGKEIDGLRRQLDIAQRVISEHDLNCLPHIVLSTTKVPDTQLTMFSEYDVEGNNLAFKGTIDRQQLVDMPALQELVQIAANKPDETLEEIWFVGGSDTE